MAGSEDMPFVPCWYVYKKDVVNIYDAWQSVTDRASTNGVFFVVGDPTILSIGDVPDDKTFLSYSHRLLII